MTNKTSESYQDYLIKSLKDPEEAIGYLTASFEESGKEGYVRALRNVIEAQQCDKDNESEDSLGILKKIEGIIVQSGQIDGDHHKAWVIDQVMRIIKGDEYESFVEKYEYFDDYGNVQKEQLYEWGVGIPP